MIIGIYDPYLDTLGGGEKYMLSIASCLSKNNEVSVFWNEDILRKAEERFNLDLSKVSIKDNIFDQKIGLIERLKKSSKYDLIIYLSDGSVPVASCRLAIHFQFPVEWIKPSFLDLLKLKRAYRIICNSEFTKKYIDKKFNANSFVLYPPVTEIKHSKDKENIILTVGRYGKLTSGKSFKKQEFLVNAFKEFLKDNPDWKFVIVTSYKKQDEDYVKELKEAVKGLPIEIIENASWEEIVDANNKAKIYWHAAGFGEDLDLNPELAEHFGIVTVEAMSAGVVPVVFAGGGQTEIVKDAENGYLWESKEELLRKTQKAVQKDVWENLSNKAKERARFFTGDRFCKELLEII